MARSNEDIERYILGSRIASEQVGPDTWVIRDPSWGGAQIVVHHAAPLVIFRVKLMDMPDDIAPAAEAGLYRHLLHLNGTEMLQGAYALEGHAIVAVEVMQDINLDENEFVAALDSLTLAITDHRSEILALVPGAQA